MNSSSRANNSAMDSYIVSLDVGTSSVRALLFDGHGDQLKDCGFQLKYDVRTTADGGVEADPEELARLCEQCLTELHGQVDAKGARAAAVGFSAFWHSFLGVAQERPTSPIFHLLDTRCAPQVEALRSRIDAEALHRRTGCVLHTSYWPGKLLWIAETRAELLEHTERWMSFGEYFYQRILGEPIASTSMASGTGLWNQERNDYDEETLAVLPVEKAQLAPPEQMDREQRKLRPEYAARWPCFDNIPWYPALGDGACGNVGSGCNAPDRYCLMVGTTGALRAITTQDGLDVPPGLFSYRLDRKRRVVGGALSNGGRVFAWMKDTLRLPDGPELEQQIAAMKPGEHGVTILPLFAGERSPHWHADARAAMVGIRLHTTPLELMRAALEAVAVEFRLIYDQMITALPSPEFLVASGGGLDHSPAWTQMMADALGHRVVDGKEDESSSRGAALYALERLGVIRDLAEVRPVVGATFDPQPEHQPVYDELRRRQEELYAALYGEKGIL